MMAAKNAEERRAELEKAYLEQKQSAFPTLPEMSVAELREVLEKRRGGDGGPGSGDGGGPGGVVVVDVRTAAEQEVSMIPGGVLRQSDFERRRAEFEGHTVVCYCTVGYRSGNYAQKLRREGSEARNLRGSILGWTHEGLPLTAEYDGAAGSARVPLAAPPGGGAAAPPPPPGETKRVHVFGDRWALQGEGYEPVFFEKGRTPWLSVLWSQLQLRLPVWGGAGKEKEEGAGH